MTIEERAIEKYDRSFEREAYCDGATDQKQKDIEKLENILNSNLYVGDELEDGWLKNSFVERLIKALEE